MRIIVFIKYYLPGYKSGGPVRTISNMVDHFGEEFDFNIITSDRDCFETEPYSNVKNDNWNSIGKTKVFYASDVRRNIFDFARILRNLNHDILYLNSFFSYEFSLLPLLARFLRIAPKKPCVIAPRGEFSEGALVLKSWKKKLYIMLVKLFGIYNRLTWHASSEHEENDIKKVMGKVAENIVIAPNLNPVLSTPSIENKKEHVKDNSILQIVYLSRVSPKKNLDFALQVLKQISIPVSLDIYGIIDNQSYWEKCKSIIGSLPANISVNYKGVINHELVQETLKAYDLFFLPTHGENYGHAIFEALSAGVPVLISDKTPWLDLDTAGVGFVRDLNKFDDFVLVIDEMNKMRVDDIEIMKQKAQKYAQRIADKKDIIDKNRNLFINLLSETKKA